MVVRITPQSLIFSFLSLHLTTSQDLQYETTPNGFTSPPKGWNSFALQAVGQLTYDQQHVQEQCDYMSNYLGSSGYRYCSLDSGWSVGDHGDDNGRIIFDPSLFNLYDLAEHLHQYDMLLGVYVVPGFFANDASKTIYGTDPPIELSTISDGNCGVNDRCQFNYSAPGVQEYCNSVVNLFAEWGVDMIKLDYVTPGSPDSGQPLDADGSNIVVCYHKAIYQSGRQMRLDISWKLDLDEPYYTRWKTNADSLRLDQDINNGQSGEPQTSFATVQRTIEYYRQYALLQESHAQALTIYPDLDNLLVGNSESLSGLTDDQRRITYSHWIAAGANLLLGSDMTALDTLGLSMLTSLQWTNISTFTSTYPSRPGIGSSNRTHGSKKQTWISGPDSVGQAFIVLVNFGTSALSLYAPNESDDEDTLTISAAGMSSAGLGETCYKAYNIWNPSNNPALANFSGFSVDLADEEVLVLWIMPNELAIECGTAMAVH